jgi:hypothetical protein
MCFPVLDVEQGSAAKPANSPGSGEAKTDFHRRRFARTLNSYERTKNILPNGILPRIRSSSHPQGRYESLPRLPSGLARLSLCRETTVAAMVTVQR